MHLSDVIGYHYDGAAYCTDCIEREPIADGPLEAYGGVVFAENAHEFIGSTCSSCQSCYGPDGWSDAAT